MLTTNEQGQYQRVTGNLLVKKGSGGSIGILVASGTPTIKVYDGLDNLGTVIVNSLATTAGNSYPIPALFTKGLYIESSGGDLTFFYT